MADVENPTTETVVSKTVEIKKEEDGTIVTEETTVVEMNGDHKPDTKDDEVLSSKKNDDIKVSEEKENGEAVKEEKAAEGETAAATTIESENTANDEQEQKEQSPPKVTLHQFPQGKHVPSLSLFCLKLETFMRLFKIPYENQYGYKNGRKGKLPWIEYKGERKVDSAFIIEYLNEKFELNIDNDLTVEQKALGRSVVSMVEDRLYFSTLYRRFVENYHEFKKNAPSGLASTVAMKMYQRKSKSYLDGQGMGRHSKDEIYHIAHEDVKAISAILGEKEYLLGDSISSYDCSIFAYLSITLWGGEEEPLAEFIKENAPNLESYCTRIKEQLWADWSDMIQGDKPEPTLKKGFSFRKKKGPKVQKNKETSEEKQNGTAEASKSDTENGDAETPEKKSEEEEKPKDDKLQENTTESENNTDEVKKTENIDSEQATQEVTTNEE